MKRTILAGIAVLALGPLTANAAPVCSGCEYLDTLTYLGLHNPETFDNSTFTHTDIESNVGGGGIAFAD